MKRNFSDLFCFEGSKYHLHKILHTNNDFFRRKIGPHFNRAWRGLEHLEKKMCTFQSSNTVSMWDIGDVG